MHWAARSWVAALALAGSVLWAGACESGSAEPHDPGSAASGATAAGAQSSGGATAPATGGAVATGGASATGGGTPVVPATGGTGASEGARDGGPPADAGLGGDAAVQNDAGPTGDAGASGDAGPSDDAGAGGDRCGVAIYDPLDPPSTRPVRGSLITHDPVVIEHDGSFTLYWTATGVGVKTSDDLVEWRSGPSAFPTDPAWTQSISGFEFPWAPDISYFGGSYHLYYSASSFGSQNSCIGHASRTSLDSGAWQDHGPVLCSQPGHPYNAIDPNVVVDQAGTPWLSFGSHWGGIMITELTEDGDRATGDDAYSTEGVETIATRGSSDPTGQNRIEAPFIVRRCGYYYLFVSFDACCAEADSTYNIRVGRSREVTGPYLDKDGVSLLNGGGTLLVEGAGEWAAAGHNAILFVGDEAFNIYHAYPDEYCGPCHELRIAEIAWDAEGWPISAGP